MTAISSIGSGVNTVAPTQKRLQQPQSPVEQRPTPPPEREPRATEQPRQEQLASAPPKDPVSSGSSTNPQINAYQQNGANPPSQQTTGSNVNRQV